MFSWKNNSFVNNLRFVIDNTCIYSPTGKYGKNEVDRYATSKEKLEKLLLADPKNIDDLTAYVFFVDSINGFKCKEVYNKVNSLLEQAKLMGVSESELAIAQTVFNKAKKKKISKRIIIGLVWVIAIAGIIVLNIKSLWFLLLTLPILSIPIYVGLFLEDHDENPFW